MGWIRREGEDITLSNERRCQSKRECRDGEMPGLSGVWKTSNWPSCSNKSEIHSVQSTKSPEY